MLHIGPTSHLFMFSLSKFILLFAMNFVLKVNHKIIQRNNLSLNLKPKADGVFAKMHLIFRQFFPNPDRVSKERNPIYHNFLSNFANFLAIWIHQIFQFKVAEIQFSYDVQFVYIVCVQHRAIILKFVFRQHADCIG